MGNKKGQVFPFMILVAVILIVAIAATMYLGEAAFLRIRLANIGDSALINAASSFCRGFNQMRIIHKQLLLNHMKFQIELLIKGAYANKLVALEDIIVGHLLWWEAQYNLYKQAQQSANDMPKDLRISIYETALGGGLIDEPKIFEPDEYRLDAHGRVEWLDYASYSARPVHYVEVLRQFKRQNKDTWYNMNRLTYSFNKKDKQKVASMPGEISASGPLPNYEAYLDAEVSGLPNYVRAANQWMVLIYFYHLQIPVPPGDLILPGFFPDPWAWIRSIDTDSQNFSLTLRKQDPFRILPFSTRQTNTLLLEHRNRVKIRGNIWLGYDYVLEEP